MHLEKRIVIPCLGLGLGPFVMQATDALLNIAFNSSLQHYGGDIAVGCMTISSTIQQMVWIPVQGIGQGAQPIISYNYGARRPQKNTSGRYHHGCFSADLYAAHLERDSGCTSLPDRYFQLGSGPDDRYRPRHETLFCCIYLHAAAICGPDSVQIAEQAPPRGVFLAAAQGHHCVPLTYLLPYAFGMGTDGVFAAEPGFQRDRRQFVLYCNADYRFAGAETDESGRMRRQQNSRVGRAKPITKGALCRGRLAGHFFAAFLSLYRL